ncbi:MAG: hypothetical protein HDR22_06630 [Lachnospiraceae bacterium]|nr:hypothetical protein [Lachnospiraceae bacterium]
MKRICMEPEKALLYKNRKQILEGIYQTSSRSRFSHAFIVMFLSVIAMFAGLWGRGYLFHDSKPVMFLGMLICFTVFHSIFHMIFNELRIKRAKKAFMKKETLMINGATLVQIETNDRFLYIEDDFLDEAGKPILLEYPSRLLEISQEDVGKRFLVIYDDCSFQLARLNDKLRSLIPDHSSLYPLTGELSEYSRLPHPNMENLEKDGHELSGHEKERFANLYVNVVQSIIFRSLKTVIITIAVLLTILSILLNFIEDGCALNKTFSIEAAAIIGLLLIPLICKVIGKEILRQQGMNLIHVKEVIFHSYVINGSTITVKVYEWYNGQARLCRYPAGNQVAPDTVYGSVLYKFTKQNGDCFLLNTSPVRKKGN